MCDIPKNLEKWVESKYVKGERLGIVPGTWFGKRMDVEISNIFLNDMLYTVGFVKMRRIQRYHFYYMKRVGKRTPQQNTVFLSWHYVNDAVLMELQYSLKRYQILNPMVPVSCESEQNWWMNEYFTCFLKYKKRWSAHIFINTAWKNMILVLLDSEC